MVSKSQSLVSKKAASKMNKFDCGLWSTVKQDQVETKECPKVQNLPQWSPYIDYSAEKEEEERRQAHAFMMGTLSEMVCLACFCTVVFTLIKML